MIETSEFRIGNLVNAFGYGYSTIFQLTEVQLHISVCNENIIVENCRNLIEPVKLTEELLIDFFGARVEQWNGGMSFLLDITKSYAIRLLEDEEGFYYNNGGFICIRIIEAHKLQNVYRLFSSKELPFNLR